MFVCACVRGKVGKSVRAYVHACHCELLSPLACCFPSRLSRKAASQPSLTKSEVSWRRKPQQRNRLKDTTERHIAREHVNLWAKRFLTSVVAESGKGVT